MSQTRVNDLMVGLVERFGQILDEEGEKLRTFAKNGVQVEGWLKGELLHFFNNEAKSQRIEDFRPEHGIGGGRRKVDFQLEFATPCGRQVVYVEVKHWLIGLQKGTRYNAGFYFGDKLVGIRPDVEKLGSLPNENIYVLILCTSNPGQQDWRNGIEKFNMDSPSLRVHSLTEPTGFPDFYGLGLLKVVHADNGLATCSTP